MAYGTQNAAYDLSLFDEELNYSTAAPKRQELDEPQRQGRKKQNSRNKVVTLPEEELNKIRRAIPALQMGQYTVSSNYVNGNMAYIRRYTEDSADSLACVSISGSATFKNIPNGKYVDAVTGDVQQVTNGTLTVSSLGKANMRVYVCCASGFTGIDGAVGETTSYLK